MCSFLTYLLLRTQGPGDFSNDSARPFFGRTPDRDVYDAHAELHFGRVELGRSSVA